MMILALTLSSLLVTVRVESLAHVTLTWSTHRVAPPVSWTRLLSLQLTISTTEQRRLTLTMIPVLRPGVTRAAAVASTGVQMTHIVTLLSNISTLTSTPGSLPALLTRGVVWTRGSVSITRPSLITSCDHAVLQLGTQVSLLVTSTNANILNKQRLESKVRSWRKYIDTR